MLAGQKRLRILLSDWYLTFLFLQNLLLVLKTIHGETRSAILIFFIVLKEK